LFIRIYFILFICLFRSLLFIISVFFLFFYWVSCFVLNLTFSRMSFLVLWVFCWVYFSVLLLFFAAVFLLVLCSYVVFILLDVTSDRYVLELLFLILLLLRRFLFFCV